MGHGRMRRADAARGCGARMRRADAARADAARPRRARMRRADAASRMRHDVATCGCGARMRERCIGRGCRRDARADASSGCGARRPGAKDARARMRRATTPTRRCGARGEAGCRAGNGAGYARQARAGQGRAGQGRAGQGRAGQGRAGQGRAGRAGEKKGRPKARRDANPNRTDSEESRPSPAAKPDYLAHVTFVVP